MEAYIGTILLFAGNFAPKGWEFCNGQILPIARYSALFSLLGTTYGGDGTTTFALPDLRGRVPVHAGQGTGLAAHPLGQAFGAEQVTLTTAQLPAHTHATNFTLPVDELPMGTTPTPSSPIGYNAAAGAAPTPVQSLPTGGSMPVSIVPPSLALNYIICNYGIFPSRP